MSTTPKYPTLAAARNENPDAFDALITAAVFKAVEDIGGPLVFARALWDASHKPWTPEERREALAA